MSFEGYLALSMVESSEKAVTPELYIVADLDSLEGSELLEQALISYRDAQDVEVVILHNPALEESQHFPFSAMISESMQNTEEPFNAITLISFLALVKSLGEQGNLSQLKEQYTDDVRRQASSWWQLCQPFIRHLGFERGQNANHSEWKGYRTNSSNNKFWSR